MSVQGGALCLSSPAGDHAWPVCSAPGPRPAGSAEVPRAFPTDSCDLHAACQHRVGQLQPGESAPPHRPHPRQVTHGLLPPPARWSEPGDSSQDSLRAPMEPWLRAGWREEGLGGHYPHRPSVCF